MRCGNEGAALSEREGDALGLRDLLPPRAHSQVPEHPLMQCEDFANRNTFRYASYV